MFQSKIGPNPSCEFKESGTAGVPDPAMVSGDAASHGQGLGSDWRIKVPDRGSRFRSGTLILVGATGGSRSLTVDLGFRV